MLYDPYTATRFNNQFLEKKKKHNETKVIIQQDNTSPFQLLFTQCNLLLATSFRITNTKNENESRK